jgi:PAS domain S-box-containing protein
MLDLSQNKKIAISAVVIFIISFAAMIFFLDVNSSDSGKTNVFSSEHEEESASGEEFNYLNIDAVFMAYLNNLEGPVFVTNSNGKFEYANQEFCRLAGLDCNDLTGKKLFDYIHPKDLPDFVGTHTTLIQSGDQKEGIGPFRIVNEKREKLVLLNALPVSGEKGVEKIIFSAKDLTSKVKEFNNDKSEKDTEKDKTGSWIDKLYPKIKNMNDVDSKLLVKKVSYK